MGSHLMEDVSMIHTVGQYSNSLGSLGNLVVWQHSNCISMFVCFLCKILFIYLFFLVGSFSLFIFLFLTISLSIQKDANEELEEEWSLMQESILSNMVHIHNRLFGSVNLVLNVSSWIFPGCIFMHYTDTKHKMFLKAFWIAFLSICSSNDREHVCVTSFLCTTIFTCCRCSDLMDVWKVFLWWFA